jgi:beta-lactamase regulating signal transducer with metallopeptidase domain
MFLLNLLENASLAGWLANAAGQLLIISILGFIAVKLLTGESAPVRSVTAAGGLVSMLLVFVMSAAFQVSSIAWYKADLSSLAAPRPAAATAIPTAATAIPAAAPVMETITRALTDSQPLPDIRMESDIPMKPAATVATDRAKPAINFQLKAENYVNALGLLWAGGVIFMLLKLGYGLAFIRGFRFGLNRISDAKVDRLLKIAAETFNKQRLPELYTSPQVESPVTIGMTNPIVIIPEKLFATLSDNELKSILLHELAHI